MSRTTDPEDLKRTFQRAGGAGAGGARHSTRGAPGMIDGAIMSRNFDKRVIRILQERGRGRRRPARPGRRAGEEGEQLAQRDPRQEGGIIEENDLLGLLAQRLRVTPINLPDCVLDPEVVRIIPKEMATDHHMVPIAHRGHVTIAVSNPFDVVTLDQLRNRPAASCGSC